MKIDTLVNLIGGELLNSPYISEVTSFVINPDEVVRGSCFFVNDSEDVQTAVKNGAYAVISENYEEITDNEIAWIKVDSIQKAVSDIFKYENLKTKIYFCDEITKDIIKHMNINKEVVIVETYKDLIKSLNIQNKTIVTSKSKYAEMFSNVEVLLPKEIELKQLSLFVSAYNNTEINLPYVYRDEFSRAVNFFESYSFKYTLEFELERFKPVFVDYRLREVEYGESEKVLIKGVKNDRFFFKELNYLIDNTKHAKTIIVNEENKNLLNSGFNFAMLVDYDVDTSENESEGSLF